MPKNTSDADGLKPLFDEAEELRAWVECGFQEETFAYKNYIADLAVGLSVLGISTRREILALAHGSQDSFEELLKGRSLGSAFDADELKAFIEAVTRDEEALELILAALTTSQVESQPDELEAGELDQPHASPEATERYANDIPVKGARSRKHRVAAVAVGFSLVASLAIYFFLTSERLPTPYVADVISVDGTKERVVYPTDDITVTVEHGRFLIYEQEHLVAFTGDIEVEHDRHSDGERGWTFVHELEPHGRDRRELKTSTLGTRFEVTTTAALNPFIVSVTEDAVRVNGLGCSIKVSAGQEARLRQDYGRFVDSKDPSCPSIWLSDHEMSCDNGGSCSIGAKRNTERRILLQRAREHLIAGNLHKARQGFGRAKALADEARDVSDFNSAVEGLIDVAHAYVKEGQLVEAEAQLLETRAELDPSDGVLFESVTMELLEVVGLLAEKHYAEHELEEAIAKYKEVIRFDDGGELGRLAQKRTVKIYREIAEEHERNEQWAGAEEAYRNAMRLADQLGDGVSSDAAAGGLARALEAQALEIERQEGVTETVLEKYTEIVGLGERAGYNRYSTAKTYLRRYGARK